MHVSNLLHLAGQGWLWQAVLIILGTFVLEDAATVVAAMEAQTGTVSLPVALVSLYIGIVLGDLGLYGMGTLAARVPWTRRWISLERIQQGQAWLHHRIFRVVLVSRFLPGMRLPVYTACGYLGADIKQFALAAVVATLAWTSLLFCVSLQVGQFLIDHFGAWRWAGAAGVAIGVVILGRVAARMQTAHREERS